MAKTFFIAGTDTDVGKTFITVALLQALAGRGKTTLAMKPVAAGCNSAGQNGDALALMAAMTAEISYQQVNPVALKAAIAPHIAAQRQGRRIHIDRLVGIARGLALRSEDYLLVEGAGGWLCPVNDRHTLADFARSLAAPVILVVGLRLGCLNHALLTVQAIRAMGLPIAGWLGNSIDVEMPELDANIEYLHRHIPAPCLGIVPANCDPLMAAQRLNISPLDGS